MNISHKIVPLAIGRKHDADLQHSRLFEDHFNPAILGTITNEQGSRGLAYDEEKLIDLMVAQLREDTDNPDEILWEDGAMFITDGLDQALLAMKEWAPVVI